MIWQRTARYVLICSAACVFTSGKASAQQVQTIPAPPTRNGDSWSILIGQNYRAWVDRILEQPLTMENRAVPCDFLYDARTRRACFRSANVYEVADPGDIRFLRIPGNYPNDPDPSRGFDVRFPLIGQIGASMVNTDGTVSSYFGVLQFFGDRDVWGTGYMCLSTATAGYGMTRAGTAYTRGDEICHVLLDRTGRLTLGADTDPRAMPANILEVNGNATVHGNLIVEGWLKVAGQTIGKCM